MAPLAPTSHLVPEGVSFMGHTESQKFYFYVRNLRVAQMLSSNTRQPVHTPAIAGSATVHQLRPSVECAPACSGPIIQAMPQSYVTLSPFTYEQSLGTHRLQQLTLLWIPPTQVARSLCIWGRCAGKTVSRAAFPNNRRTGFITNQLCLQRRKSCHTLSQQPFSCPTQWTLHWAKLSSAANAYSQTASNASAWTSGFSTLCLTMSYVLILPSESSPETRHNVLYLGFWWLVPLKMLKTITVKAWRWTN